MKSFDGLSHSDAFRNALMEKVRRHPALAEDLAEPMGRTTERKMKEGVEKKDDELIDPLTS